MTVEENDSNSNLVSLVYREIKLNLRLKRVNYADGLISYNAHRIPYKKRRGDNYNRKFRSEIKCLYCKFNNKYCTKCNESHSHVCRDMLHNSSIKYFITYLQIMYIYVLLHEVVLTSRSSFVNTGIYLRIES